MKKIYKIFMAVAAVAGVTACTTDVTEDLGVNLNGGQTTLTLSLDDTRTQLGAKDDNGIYKLTWSVDDKISVNGSASNPLTADEAGATTATFNFEKGFGSAPYFIAYPAVEGTTNQVVFAAEQTHTSNTTFGNGAAVMYGYANDLNNVTLKHLTGVLKIGVVYTEEGQVTLKSVRISTVDRKPIAGTFSVDAEGKLTPVNTTDVITYTFSEGVDLTAEPTYIHVAVPAGVYGELYVTLEAETEKAMDDLGMNIQKITAYSYKTVTTDSTKPVNPGVVREFSTPIPYSAVDSNSQFIIKDYNSLEIFAEAVKESTEEAPVTKNAVFVADVEIPDTGWTTVNAQYYTGTINGNGYAIKGLNAPLFNNLGANVKGLHLEDVAITATASANFGILANTYYGSSISNCSTEGTVTIKITKDATTFVGGFVGQTMKAATLSNLVNDVDITTSGELSQISLGGIAGSIGSKGNTVATTATNLTNKGDLIVKDTKFACSARTTNNNFGGIVGYGYGAFTASDLTNEGAIHIVKTTKPTTKELGKINLGGILGLNGAVVTAEDWHNKGDILLQNIKLDCSYFNIGGIISYNNAANSSYTNLTNEGSITVSNVELTYTSGCYMEVGGVFGTAVKSTNLGGNITNKGDVVCRDITTADADKNPGFGGIIGLSGTGDTKYFVLKDDIVLNNSGDVKVYGGKYSGNFGIAGIIGCNKSAIAVKNATNTGNIISATTFAEGKHSFVAGICGGTWEAEISNSKSYCNVAAFIWDGKANSVPTIETAAQVGILSSTDYVKDNTVNCQIGGGWYKSATVVTNKNGELELDITYEDVTSSNFFKYISATSNPTSAPGDSVCKYWDGK